MSVEMSLIIGSRWDQRNQLTGTQAPAMPMTTARNAATNPRRRSPGRVGRMVANPRATAATAV